jgi:hypothetical protein
MLNIQGLMEKMFFYGEITTQFSIYMTLAKMFLWAIIDLNRFFILN